MPAGSIEPSMAEIANPPVSGDATVVTEGPPLHVTRTVRSSDPSIEAAQNPNLRPSAYQPVSHRSAACYGIYAIEPSHTVDPSHTIDPSDTINPFSDTIDPFFNMIDPFSDTFDLFDTTVLSNMPPIIPEKQPTGSPLVNSKRCSSEVEDLMHPTKRQRLPGSGQDRPYTRDKAVREDSVHHGPSLGNRIHQIVMDYLDQARHMPDEGTLRYLAHDKRVPLPTLKEWMINFNQPSEPTKDSGYLSSTQTVDPKSDDQEMLLTQSKRQGTTRLVSSPLVAKTISEQLRKKLIRKKCKELPQGTCPGWKTCQVQEHLECTERKRLLRRDPSRIYQCTRKCGYKTNRKESWKRHEKLHCLFEVFICHEGDCSPSERSNTEEGKIFCRLDNFRTHMSTHQSRIADAAVPGWNNTYVTGIPVKTWCGLCEQPHHYAWRSTADGFNARINHLAGHFETGKCMADWKSENDLEAADSDEPHDRPDDDSDHDAHLKDYRSNNMSSSGQNRLGANHHPRSGGGGSSTFGPSADDQEPRRHGDQFTEQTTIKNGDFPSPETYPKILSKRFLGVGSQALVDEISIPRMGTTFARKQFRRLSQPIQSSYHRELEALTHLRHPNIVNLAGFNGIGGDMALLLSPVADANLAAYLEELSNDPHGRNTSHLLLDIRSHVVDLVCAINHIHGKGVVHQDIKPANILVVLSVENRSPRFLLSDFGSSHFKDRNSDTLFRGTPMYASHEALNQMLPGFERDIWSLGCVVLEMVTVAGGIHLHELWHFLGHENFSSSPERTQEWVNMLEKRNGNEIVSILRCVKNMLVVNPLERPTAEDILERFSALHLESSTKQGRVSIGCRMFT